MNFQKDESVLRKYVSIFPFHVVDRFQVDDLFLQFAKKASAFNSWYENAEEDLTDPVRCNSLEELKVLCKVMMQYFPVTVYFV